VNVGASEGGAVVIIAPIFINPDLYVGSYVGAFEGNSVGDAEGSGVGRNGR